MRVCAGFKERFSKMRVSSSHRIPNGLSWSLDVKPPTRQQYTLRFEIRHSSHREEIFSDSDFVVFGRDPSCDIVIKNPRVSRRHASLRTIPDGFHLLDMGSSNGVYVLGQKVDDAIIREEDVFSMGDVFVRVLPDDMPVTLAMSKLEAAALRSSPRMEAPRRLPAPPPPRRAESSDGTYTSIRKRAPLMAPQALGVVSIAVSVGLILGPLSLASQIGVLAYVLPAVGVLSALAGLGVLSGGRWARSLHYALFTMWTLTCLLAPFGVIGFAYQMRGEDRPDTDAFFTALIGIAGVLAIIALLAAAFLVRIYVPAPLPL